MNHFFCHSIHLKQMSLCVCSQKCFFEHQSDEETNEAGDLDNINESSDLIAAPSCMENTENEAPNHTEKENGEDQGNRTDDDSASDSGVSRKSEAVDYTKSTEFKNLLKEIKQNLLCATRLQLKNSSALVRRVAVLLLEFLGTTTLNIDELLLSYVSIDRDKPLTLNRKSLFIYLILNSLM